MPREIASAWASSPETILSHHYKLYSRTTPYVDTSPPFSLYNSPKSIHYIPRRSRSADNVSRPHLFRRPQSELSAFVNGRLPRSLRLPLGPSVESVLLHSKHYHPPSRRKEQEKEEERITEQVIPRIPKETIQPIPRRNTRKDETALQFKNAVYSRVIERGFFSDGVIQSILDEEEILWQGRLSEKEIENLRYEIYGELDMKETEQYKDDFTDRTEGEGSTSSSSSSSPTTSSSSTNSSFSSM